MSFVRWNDIKLNKTDIWKWQSIEIKHRICLYSNRKKANEKKNEFEILNVYAIKGWKM